jgi:hypothetical protein
MDAPKALKPPAQRAGRSGDQPSENRRAKGECTKNTSPMNRWIL